MYCHFALIIAVFVAGAKASCSEYELEQCMTPIIDYRNKLGISDKLAYFPLYSLNDEQLNDYCKYARSVKVCRNGLNYCDNDVSILLDGFLDSVDFLCKENMEEYKSHQQCYATSIVQQGLQDCNTEASVNFKSITTYTSMAKDKFCGYIKEDYRCIRDVVEPVCGKDAAEWQVNFVKKVIKPITSIANCGAGNINVTESSTAIPKWAIFIIAISVFLVVGITYVICRVTLSGKKIKNTRPALQFNNVLANPAAAQAPLQYGDVVKMP